MCGFVERKNQISRIACARGKVIGKGGVAGIAWYHAGPLKQGVKQREDRTKHRFIARSSGHRGMAIQMNRLHRRGCKGRKTRCTSP
jgi:hypothetical protein